MGWLAALDLQHDRASSALAFAKYASTPELLKEKAGVDVIEGKIQYELEKGNLSWVAEPELPNEYERLIRYIAAVMCGKRVL